jgi:hypothetical protein
MSDDLETLEPWRAMRAQTAKRPPPWRHGIVAAIAWIAVTLGPLPAVGDTWAGVTFMMNMPLSGWVAPTGTMGTTGLVAVATTNAVALGAFVTCCMWVVAKLIRSSTK